MTDWKITRENKPKIDNPVLIEGLPGLGNVGKIATDLLVDQLEAEKIADFFSYNFPNSVFVSENNLIEMPKIELYHKKISKKHFLFLVGDVQPTSEEASFEFTEKILDMMEDYGCKEIITLGGIGINEDPDEPEVYCTGNDKKLVEELSTLDANEELYGVVGPIVGVSGLLLGMAKKRNIKAASLLAETYAHPMYVGLRGAKETLQILNKRYKFGISMEEINKEIDEYEKELNSGAKKKHKAISQLQLGQETTNYIG